MTEPAIAAIAPFLIVGDMQRTLAFYRDALGFSVIYSAPDKDPFFAIVQRDAAILHLKVVEADPLPNAERDPDARFDAFLTVPDPNALAGAFAARGVAFKAPLQDTEDGLRGFELADPDGYVLFFGHPKG